MKRKIKIEAEQTIEAIETGLTTALENANVRTDKPAFALADGDTLNTLYRTTTGVSHNAALEAVKGVKINLDKTPVDVVDAIGGVYIADRDGRLNARNFALSIGIVKEKYGAITRSTGEKYKNFKEAFSELFPDCAIAYNTANQQAKAAARYYLPAIYGDDEKRGLYAPLLDVPPSVLQILNPVDIKDVERMVKNQVVTSLTTAREMRQIVSDLNAIDGYLEKEFPGLRDAYLDNAITGKQKFLEAAKTHDEKPKAETAEDTPDETPDANDANEKNKNANVRTQPVECFDLTLAVGFSRVEIHAHMPIESYVNRFNLITGGRVRVYDAIDLLKVDCGRDFHIYANFYEIPADNAPKRESVLETWNAQHENGEQPASDAELYDYVLGKGAAVKFLEFLTTCGLIEDGEIIKIENNAE